jgi:hypothetical protein
MKKISLPLLGFLSISSALYAQWNPAGADTYTTSKVGIGINLPLFNLDVAGKVRVFDSNYPGLFFGFGMNGDFPSRLSIDVVNSPIEGDALDLVYDRGIGVNIGRSGQNRLLNVFGRLKVSVPGDANNYGFGMNGDAPGRLSIDVINSPTEADPLDLVFDRGVGVNIGKTGQNRLLNVFGRLRLSVPGDSYEYGFGMSGDAASRLSIDVVNSQSDNDPLELVYNRGTGVNIGRSDLPKFLNVYGPLNAYSSLRLSLTGDATEYGFGVNGESAKGLTIDYINSGIASDPLELCYSRGSGVTVGSSASPGKYLSVFGPLNAYGSLRLSLTGDATEYGFGVNGESAKGLSIDYINSGIATDPLELCYSRGPGVTIGAASMPERYLKVYGKAYAKEVNVTLSIPGPDYVFAKDYDLKPLSEVEKFVAENSHLEGIPTAKEMETNGINVGEMEFKLLEKVEELTLYLIEQNKKLEAQAKEIAALKAKVNK